MSKLVATFDDGMRIVTFDPAYAGEFRRLNIAWLNRHFRVEPIDEQVLGNPEGEIVAPGGEILFACLNQQVIGTVGLKAEENGTFELTKMAVDESWQGRGFGRRLLAAAEQIAKQRGAKKLILYSQRSLGAAIHLYRSFGFTETPVCDKRYSRCDIKMERALPPVLDE
jgi:ribosomal protein S18 acetylase RimI-like enzyme